MKRFILTATAFAAMIMIGNLFAQQSFALPPDKETAVVDLADKTQVLDKVLQGTYLFEHDDARMARGEPCTRVLRFNPGKGPAEELVAFHCKPRWGQAPDKFTAATSRLPDGMRVLTEYQFAGDDEAHGVPVKAQ